MKIPFIEIIIRQRKKQQEVSLNIIKNGPKSLFDFSKNELSFELKRLTGLTGSGENKGEIIKRIKSFYSNYTDDIFLDFRGDEDGEI